MAVPVITSRRNNIIRDAASLADAACRRESGMFLAEGARLCADAAVSGIKIKTLFYTEKASQKYGGYLSPIKDISEKSYIVEEHVAQLLSQTKHPQGIFCQCIIPIKEKVKLNGKSAVFEDMQDPTNLGTAIRTAEALGIDHVILLGERQDVYAPKVIRASMGAVFRQTVSEYANRDDLFLKLKEEGCTTYAAALSDTNLFLGRFKFPDNAAVFIGNEGNGLTKETMESCDYTVTIPMKGKSESLNAAAAAAVIMWEMKR